MLSMVDPTVGQHESAAREPASHEGASRDGAAVQAAVPAPARRDLLGVLPVDMDRTLAGFGWPAYRGKQVRQWVYEKCEPDPSAMTNLPAAARGVLAERFAFITSSVIRRQQSADGTDKMLLGFPGGAQAECVMIPDQARRTACISSQVGCPVGCRFCASGIDGLKQNLSAGQVVEQAYVLNRALVAAGERLTNIVFMGMGEPLANYAAVMDAVRILHHPECMNLGARRITISTVGLPPRIRQLAGEGLPINLALSLHAPDEALRRELIPWAEHWPIDEILDACRYYFDKTGREITLEYILLSGVNDRPLQARQLASLCRTLRANVNLIRYNEVSTLPYRRPSSEDVVRFQQVLRDNGVNAHVRKSRGRDIDAACGQLRRREESLVRLGTPSAAADSASAPASSSSGRGASAGPRGFTLAELLVVLAMLAVLLSIFVPYLASLRESDRRQRCAEHLRELGVALRQYAADNSYDYPRVREPWIDPPATGESSAQPAERRYGGYTSFSGRDSGDPFAADSTVRPGDVTASLYLLVRGGYQADGQRFVCPSADESALSSNQARVLANFAPRALSYGYATPFSASPAFRLNADRLRSEFVLMGDRASVRVDAGGRVLGPAHDADLPEFAAANSDHHRGAGQNALYATGVVQFVSTPFVGAERDHIYTALSDDEVRPGPGLKPTSRGFAGDRFGPAWAGDTVLTPYRSLLPAP